MTDGISTTVAVDGQKKIYGPYLRKDNRKHICIIHPDGRRQTKSYPRYLMEKHIGRELLESETIDHIDDDFTNDDIDNLQILTLVENVKKELKKDRYKPKYATFKCPVCGVIATKRESSVRHNLTQCKSGPFCSRSCAGTFTTVAKYKGKAISTDYTVHTL